MTDLSRDDLTIEQPLAQHLQDTLDRVARAVTPTNAAPGTDETGAHVESLTEAVMGMTSGLLAIAGAIADLADAVDRHGS